MHKYLFLLLLLSQAFTILAQDTPKVILDIPAPWIKTKEANSQLNVLNSSSTLIMLDGKLYSARDFDRLNNEKLEEINKRIEFIYVLDKRNAIDSIFCKKIETLIIIKTKQD